MKIKLCSDSTCDLPQALLDKYSISTVPLTVTMGEKAYRDGLDICSEEIFRHVQAGNPLPKTSAGNVGEYAAYFAPWVEQGYEVIHISLSSCISSAFSNASLAAEELGHVTVIDSLNLCGAQGLLVLRCADLIAEGKSVEEIVPELLAYRSLQDSSFIVDRVDYLHKGGRCSAIEMLGANVLKLRPCIHVREGKLIPGKKYRGSFQRVLSQYAEACLSDRESIDTSRIVLASTGCSQEAVDTLRQEVLRLCPDVQELIETYAGSTISSHCGPGTVGLFFAGTRS